MIHAHIKAAAASVDEERFQVRLPDRYSNENENFQDGDRLNPDWLKRVFHRMFSAKLRAAGIGINSGSKGLDVCCGQGFLGEFLGSTGVSMTFCDISTLQLAALRRRLSSQEAPPRVVEADLAALPFMDGEFDLVVGNSFLHHLPDVPRGLSELARVLKPGGRLILFHEPGIKANYWETFPLSAVRDTTYREGFTDLWQFESERLSRVISENGFSDQHIIGSGIVSALALNAYLIVMGKLGVTQRWAIEPALRMRPWCNRLEGPLKACLRPDAFPSLFITAIRRQA